MSSKLKIACAWTAVMIVIVSCALSGGDLSEEEKLQTAVALALEAVEVEEDDGGEAQIPTITISPTDTPEGPPTDTPEPCNRAKFISETIEDGTDFDPNESFTKTWRLRNDGTCTWNANYKLVFVDGDQLSGPSTKNLTQSVAPGEQVDISVNLKAPGSGGTYKGFWKVADDEGEYFVHNIWVEIEVINPILILPGPLVILKADLIVTEFSLNPATPTADDSMHTRVKVKNQGGTNAGAFKVEWYGLNTFTNPSCTWNIVGGLAKGDTVLVECDFTFASWYPLNKTTIVYVDVDDTVDETNEGNNSASISPFGVNP
ncbi:MAG: NBR1-Ig-like domain-containing protein [Pelolinea sp.]|nr:NBR1-Ig-like domain-containing protein [Pelolinea sp.]